MKRGWWIGRFFLFGVLGLGLIGLVTMTLWNGLVPVLFSGPVITFWQAIGLLLLSKILFWSWGGKSHADNGSHWKSYWKNKWNSMTPDDRERLKQKMKDKWCGWDSKAPPKNSDSSNG
jgi:hypothetical protein